MNELLNEAYLLQNAAATLDGVELRWEGDKCGKRAYRIKRESIGSLRYWQAFFYDWHDGWIQINNWPGEKLHKEAVELCNRHAVDKRLIKFLPTRPKFKATWGGWGMAAASQVAAVAGLGL